MKSIHTLLSFVIPCYRSEETITKVIEEIINVVSQRPAYDYEIICVNDFSPDDVYQVLQELAVSNSKIKVVNLAQNVGKHGAILAGYSFAKGEFIVNIDDDFQCPVYELWRLLEPVEQDQCDVATADYYKKKQPLWKNIGSNINLIMSSIMLGKPRTLRFENFIIMRRFVMNEIIKYIRPYPYLEGLILRVTRRIATVKMEERARGDDKATGFTFSKSVSLWVNGFTAFSVKPLRISAVLGFFIAVIGFLLGLYMVVNKFIRPNIPAGYTSLIAVQLFTSGVIMIILGLIGEYIGRIYICLNNSPQYVVRDTLNL